VSEQLSTHVNSHGNYHMVDVGSKGVTSRQARAEAIVEVGEELFNRLRSSGETKKGDVFSVAVVAGIMAAKNCSGLIPLCHPLALSKVEINYDFVNGQIRFESIVECQGKTGVEMEALVAVNIAALTLYDMCKSIWKGIKIDSVRLLHKSGGQSGEYYAK
jgi:cyclic pyranopterin monophosphate synthase